MIKDGLLTMLKKLEERLPPPPKCHHSIHFAKYGNDEDGWTDQLALTINVHGDFVTLFFDDTDFDKPIDDLVKDLIFYYKHGDVNENSTRICE